uniref:GMP synthase [glutamine-hydrolyzing] n=1 Tax=Zeugodacus cucurbitae TaxID=28588 RepID=A0A0A1X4I4_ZEUCU
MNDYLNANSSNTITSTTTGAARAHFHELIDHLMQLEISDIDASLPKITLTDCSTIANTAPVEVAHTDSNTTATSHTNDNAFAFQFNNTYNCNNFSAYNAFDLQVTEQKQQQQLEQQVQTSARRNGFTLRQTKFGTSYSSLDIPDEVYYNSEARPP